MAIPVGLNRVNDYVLKSHKKLPEDQRAVFKIKILTQRKFAKVVSLFKVIEDEQENLDKINEAFVEICKASLKTCKNLYDDEGNKFEYSYKEADRLLDCLTFSEIRELNSAIIETNIISEEQAKN
ncbi:hypothetical protein J7L67_01900 [bacterium]|nr:hypothetical protein [bacterium]